MPFDEPMHYRLMNEYGVLWPFWADVGKCGPGQPDLPPRVEAAVRAWAANFNDRYSWESGWPTEGEAREHASQAQRLVEILAGLLPEVDSIELDLWETDRRKGL